MTARCRMTLTVYCCTACGRWGTRGYRPADDGRDGHVCSNDRACRRRRERTETP